MRKITKQEATDIGFELITNLLLGLVMGFLIGMLIFI